MLTLALCASLARAAPPPWLIPASPAATSTRDDTRSKTPRDTQQDTQRASDAAAWRLFIALNWPARLGTRLADPQARLGAQRPVVWETWKNANEVLRPDGADPGPWEAAPPPDSEAARFAALSSADLQGLRHIVHGRMVPVTAPLLHPEKLIEVRFNRASFEHIRSRALYCLEGQLRLLTAAAPARFPAGAIQVKASWRPIEPAQRSRYHTLSVARARGSPVLYGLTALNIAVKGTPAGQSSWLWAAFEQEDNAHRASGEAWQLPSRDAWTCPEAPASCDHAPRGMGLEGTVWQHYLLRGTMSAYVDKSGAPQLLASSELEAGLQESSSCMTCHSRATIGQSAGNAAVTRLPVFQSAASGAQPRGYVGLADPGWFRPVDDRGATLATYVGLDFVWSLARAASCAQANRAGAPGGPP